MNVRAAGWERTFRSEQTSTNKNEREGSRHGCENQSPGAIDPAAADAWKRRRVMGAGEKNMNDFALHSVHFHRLHLLQTH